MAKQSYEKMPPLRVSGRDDGEDGARVEWITSLWDRQNWAVLPRDRQIEENVRMLAGQQWLVFSDILGEWLDIADFLTDEEKAWRQRPVLNRLLYWFMLTHARMTENPPILGFEPATGDKMDSELAETLDTLFKTTWREAQMPERLDRFMAWVAVAGEAYLKSRVSLEGGEWREWIGPTTVLLDPEGGSGEPTKFNVPWANFNFTDGQGNVVPPNHPQAQVMPMGHASMGENGEPQWESTGEPFRERSGKIECDVIAPPSVRGAWGPAPWHEKAWHIHRSLLTPEQVWDKYEVEVQPDTTVGGSESSLVLQRLLFGSGYFGATTNRPGSWGAFQGTEAYITVDELWHRPTTAVDGMAATKDSPGGRLLIRAGNAIVRDGPRPVRLPWTSPIQRTEFVWLPGRPSGTTPQEALNPLQRTYNRGAAQIMENRNLASNPIQILDEDSGIKEEDITNKPGLILTAPKKPGVRALEYVDPPSMPADVWRTQQLLEEEMTFIGNMGGSSGAAPSSDPSGELVKELRFNTDRFLGATMRRAVLMLGRVAEDWIAFYPTIYDQETVVAYAGEDQLAQTVTVYPELFQQGNVNVFPDIESMLPEGRGERQSRIYRMWQDGAWGPPLTPEARRMFLGEINFPHMSRAARPGGVHRRTAGRENGELLTGKSPDQIPVFRWYDHEVHLQTHYEFMASPEFLRTSRQVQAAFERHVAVHEEVLHQRLAAIQKAALLHGAAGGAQPPSPAGPAGAAPAGANGAQNQAGAGGDLAGVPSIVPRGPNVAFGGPNGSEGGPNPQPRFPGA